MTPSAALIRGRTLLLRLLTRFPRVSIRNDHDQLSGTWYWGDTGIEVVLHEERGLELSFARPVDWAEERHLYDEDADEPSPEREIRRTMAEVYRSEIDRVMGSSCFSFEEVEAGDEFLSARLEPDEGAGRQRTLEALERLLVATYADRPQVWPVAHFSSREEERT
jgi:hypothetical protein